jgi:uncharacterized protein YoxC
MSKNPLDKKELKKTIKITQNIEGYKEPTKELIAEVKTLREKYAIKVSTKRSVY